MNSTDTLLLKEILMELRRIADTINAEAKTKRVPIEEVRAAMLIGKSRFADIMNALNILPEKRGNMRYITADDVAKINNQLRNPLILAEMGLSSRTEVPKAKRYKRPPVRRESK